MKIKKSKDYYLFLILLIIFAIILVTKQLKGGGLLARGFFPPLTPLFLGPTPSLSPIGPAPSPPSPFLPPAPPPLPVPSPAGSGLLYPASFLKKIFNPQIIGGAVSRPDDFIINIDSFSDPQIEIVSLNPNFFCPKVFPLSLKNFFTTIAYAQTTSCVEGIVGRRPGFYSILEEPDLFITYPIIGATDVEVVSRLCMRDVAGNILPSPIPGQPDGLDALTELFLSDGSNHPYYQGILKKNKLNKLEFPENKVRITFASDPPGTAPHTDVYFVYPAPPSGKDFFVSNAKVITPKLSSEAISILRNMPDDDKDPFDDDDYFNFFKYHLGMIEWHEEQHLKNAKRYRNIFIQTVNHPEVIYPLLSQNYSSNKEASDNVENHLKKRIKNIYDTSDLEELFEFHGCLNRYTNEVGINTSGGVIKCQTILPEKFEQAKKECGRNF